MGIIVRFDSKEGIFIVFNRVLNEHLACFRSLAQLSEEISSAGRMLIDSIENGEKILICGNGGSASDAQHFAGEIVGRFTQERIAYKQLPWSGVKAENLLSMRISQSLSRLILPPAFKKHIFSSFISGLK